MKLMKSTRAAQATMKTGKSKSVECGPGIPCPRCSTISHKYRHPPGWTPKPDKAYFELWFSCKNKACRTTIFFGPGQHPIVPVPSLADRLMRLYWQLYNQTGITREQFAQEFREGG